MFTKEFEKVFTLDENDLAYIEGLSGDFVRATGKRRTEAEDFARSGNPEHQPLAVFGTYGELGAAIAEYKSATWLAAFRKERGAPRVLRHCLYSVKRLESIDRQVTKDAIRPQLAAEATGMGNALHAPTNTAASWSAAVTLVTKNGDG